jgi:hypothetical protein
MVLSNDQDIQREQRILLAIRESLLSDPRIARLGEHLREGNKLGEPQATVQREQITIDSPSIAASKPCRVKKCF